MDDGRLQAPLRSWPWRSVPGGQNAILSRSSLRRPRQWFEPPGQRRDMPHALKLQLRRALVGIAGCRHDGALEAQLLGLLEARHHMAGRPDGPREADLTEVDVMGAERKIGNGR